MEKGITSMVVPTCSSQHTPVLSFSPRPFLPLPFLARCSRVETTFRPPETALCLFNVPLFFSLSFSLSLVSFFFLTSLPLHLLASGMHLLSVLHSYYLISSEGALVHARDVPQARMKRCARNKIARISSINPRNVEKNAQRYRVNNK